MAKKRKTAKREMVPASAADPLQLPMTVPLADTGGDSNARESRRLHHANCQLSRDQSIALLGLYEGLVYERATLASGRPVVHQVDALRWFLEQIAAAPGG